MFLKEEGGLWQNLLGCLSCHVAVTGARPGSLDVGGSLDVAWAMVPVASARHDHVHLLRLFLP